MIYSHKPQRSGRSISSNTNNPPQDPPPPPKIDIPILDTTPSVIDVCPQETISQKQIETPITKSIPKSIVTKPKITKPIVPKTSIPNKKKLTSWYRIFTKIKNFFKRYK